MDDYSEASNQRYVTELAEFKLQRVMNYYTTGLELT